MIAARARTIAAAAAIRPTCRAASADVVLPFRQDDIGALGVGQKNTGATWPALTVATTQITSATTSVR